MSDLQGPEQPLNYNMLEIKDFVLDASKLQESVPQLMAHVRPDWGKETPLEIEKLKGGILNVMLVVFRKTHPEDKIVLRIYGEIEGLERDNREILCLKKVSSSGLGPCLLAVFKNGVCYRYIDGNPLNVDLVRSEKMIPHVVKTLARLHALPVLQNDITPSIIDEWIEEASDSYPPDIKDTIKRNRLLKVLPDKETFKLELKKVKKTVQEVDSPIVFCHNDSKAENFLWNEETGQLILIDFEHSAYGKQAMEIGQHFVVYSDIADPDSTRFPDQKYQKKWIRMYLEEWFEYTGRKKIDVTDKHVEKLYVNANKCAQMFRLVIGVGCLQLYVQGLYDCYEFCLQMLEDYMKYKSQVDSLVVTS